MIKVVLDTNILVSALIVKVGKPAQILEHIDALELLTSEEILAEVARVLHYPRIQKRYRLSDETISTFLERLRAVSTVVTVHTPVKVITADPDDDKFLACAIDGEASYIVSGDPHLLTLRLYQDIQILSPTTFLDILNQATEADGQ